MDGLGGAPDMGLNAIQMGESGEVSAEAIVKVREDMQKSAQMRGQIAQAGAQQKQFAQLLILLLQHITDEKLIGHIFRQLTVHKASIPAIFAQFLPFIVDHVALNVNAGPFVELVSLAKSMQRSLDGLVGRFKKVNTVFTHLGKQNSDQKASLVIDCAQTYGFTHLEQLDEAKRDELWSLIRKEVSGN